MLYSSDQYSVYFGDKTHAVSRALFSGIATQQELITHPVLGALKDMLDLSMLVFTQQTHSAHGYAVTVDTEHMFMHAQPEGDFLITDRPRVGLGIYTADCVPVVFYDKIKNCIGICHAGWAGSVKHVAVATLDALRENYKCRVGDITVFFGPAARGCCYAVGSDCVQKIPQEYLKKSHDIYYCDLIDYNQAQLHAQGIYKNNMHTRFALCTLESDNYCSYRRNKQTDMRQVTVVALRASLKA